MQIKNAVPTVALTLLLATSCKETPPTPEEPTLLKLCENTRAALQQRITQPCTTFPFLYRPDLRDACLEKRNNEIDDLKRVLNEKCSNVSKK